MSNLHVESVLSLYEKYRDDLKKVREEQQKRYMQIGLSRRIGLKLGLYKRRQNLFRPQLDDIEAEITYLRLRESKPGTVVEISPCKGWSTTWILCALRDNGHGRLYSYDLIDDSKKNVPASLSKNRWKFSKGDIKKNLHKLPEKIDYLFIDSDHSEEFAQWYVATLFPRLQKGTPVSVHDIFHTAEPDGFCGEGAVITSWLKKNKMDFFTAAPAWRKSNYNQIMKKKEELSLHTAIHPSQANSMFFFNYRKNTHS
jgi:predicted O-methyltransferase YrrM